MCTRLPRGRIKYTLHKHIIFKLTSLNLSLTLSSYHHSSDQICCHKSNPILHFYNSYYHHKFYYCVGLNKHTVSPWYNFSLVIHTAVKSNTFCVKRASGTVLAVLQSKEAQLNNKKTSMPSNVSTFLAESQYIQLNT